MTPELSIVVLARSARPAALAHLLERLAEQSLEPERFEVVVVRGDGPPSNVPDGNRPFALQLVSSDGGSAAARQLGLERARGELVLFLDEDDVPAHDLCAAHLAAHRSPDGALDRHAVLGASQATGDARAHPLVALLERGDLCFPRSDLVAQELHSWRFFRASNLSVSRSVLLSVGGFDERYERAGGEDRELGYRLSAIGVHVRHCPEARCENDHRWTAAEYLTRGEDLGHNLVRMWRSHADPEIFGLATSAEVESSLRSAIDVVEAHRDARVALVSALDRLEDEYWGKELPVELADRVVDLLREIATAAVSRGLWIESTGIDPDDIARRGETAGTLTSVIVVSHDAFAKTRRCINALRATRDERYPVQILVVDNGSRDGSCEWLAAQHDIELVSNDENLGAPHARNQAIARANGEWLAFLDNDVYVTSGWLERSLYHGAVDPSVGCVCLTANRASKRQQVDYPGGDGEDEIAAFARERAAEYDRRGADTELFTSLGVLVRRCVIERLGGFDTRFSPWGFEDDDFSLRALWAGFRSRVALDVFVYHDQYDDEAKSARHSALLHENWARFAKKWGAGEVPALYDYDALGLTRDRRVSAAELLVSISGGVPREKYETPTKRSVVVLGSGRSGTSMLAGTLASAGWDVGDEPYPGRDSNPKGFFETEEINGINEALLTAALPAEPTFGPMQRWLAEAPLDLPFAVPTPEIRERMASLARRRPFAYKDPRFCYTLPVWREALGDVACLCVFREPALTAESTVKECRSQGYLANVEMDFERAVAVWTSMYRHVLERHQHEGDWLFLHFDQLLTDEGLARLEEFVGAPVAREFPEARLARTSSTRPVSPEAQEIYSELCALAGHPVHPPARDANAIPAVAPRGTRGSSGTPELSVVICTYNRRDTLAHCLEAFSKQSVPAESYELIVVNDGSSDGTRELLDEWKFEVPARVVHRENGGLSAARNSGLEVARGKILLFVNDDTIATAGLVEAHVRAHRAHPERRISVLGTFEQPEAELANGLMRTLEQTSLVFCYTHLEPQRFYDWNYFWTCNVSVPADAVHEAGGFDESFRHYGCEDVDLAIRLAGLGLEVFYDDRARAFHEHVLDYDQLARRGRTVAQAWVRLARKHPSIFEHPSWSAKLELRQADLERAWTEGAAGCEMLESAARELCALDLGAIERVGPGGQELARKAVVELTGLLKVLNQFWWCRGHAEGLAEFECESFAELCAARG